LGLVPVHERHPALLPLGVRRRASRKASGGRRRAPAPDWPTPACARGGAVGGARPCCGARPPSTASGSGRRARWCRPRRPSPCALRGASRPDCAGAASWVGSARLLPRRLAQVCAAHDDAFSVRGDDQDRPGLPRRPHLDPLPVEGVEVLRGAADQLLDLAFPDLGARRGPQRLNGLVEGALRGLLRDPAAHLQRVPLRRQVQVGIERVQARHARGPVTDARDLDRAEGRLQPRACTRAAGRGTASAPTTGPAASPGPRTSRCACRSWHRRARPRCSRVRSSSLWAMDPASGEPRNASSAPNVARAAAKGSPRTAGRAATPQPARNRWGASATSG